MLKRIVFVLALCLFAAAGLVWAQETGTSEPKPVFHHLYVGLNAGYTNNTLYTSNSDSYYAFTEYRSGHGFTISIPVRYQFFSWLGVQLEPTFIQKNYSLHRTGYYSPLYSEWTNSFVDFPLMANLSLPVIPKLPQLRVFANAGGWLGVWAASHIKGTAQTTTADAYDPATSYLYYDYDEDVEFDSRRDNRFDAGLIIGGGLQYSLKICTFNVECRYYYTLTDLQKGYMRDLVPQMNDAIVVQTGVVLNSSVLDIFKKGGK
jgi:hypothetical protein